MRWMLRGRCPIRSGLILVRGLLPPRLHEITHGGGHDGDSGFDAFFVAVVHRRVAAVGEAFGLIGHAEAEVEAGDDLREETEVLTAHAGNERDDVFLANDAPEDG